MHAGLFLWFCYNAVTMKTVVLEQESDLAGVVHDVLATVSAHEDKATVVALRGDLGAGKTTFTQYLAKALGVAEQVTSPTFVIMKGYELLDQSFEQLVHIDAYRIETEEELEVLGFTALLSMPRTLVAIEWSEKLPTLLPKDVMTLTFAVTNNERSVSIAYA